MELLRVGELARRTGLTVRTLHHWEAMGLVEPARRSAAGYRLYGARELERILRILSLRQLGLTLAEVRECLDRPEAALAPVLARRIERLEAEIARQRQLRDRLKQLAARVDAAAAVSMDDLMETMEALVMFEKYFSQEQLDALAERRETVGEKRIAEVEREWAELIPAVRAQMEKGTDPADPQVQELARRWRALAAEFTGGDAGIARAVGTMYREEASVRERTGIQPELMEYVAQAWQAGPGAASSSE